jgi:hypothetical protein
MASESQSNAEEIQRQMQSVRSTLRADVKELVDNARDMTDWHYYVRRYPLASVAVAAAVGFVATTYGAGSNGAASQGATTIGSPPTFSPVSPTASPLAPVAATPMSHSAPASTSLFRDVLSFGAKMATTALARAAVTLASQQLSKFVDGNQFAAASVAKKEESTDVQSHF